MTDPNSLGVEARFYKDWFCPVNSKWPWSDFILNGLYQSSQKSKFAHDLFLKKGILLSLPPNPGKKKKKESLMMSDNLVWKLNILHFG